MDWELGLRLGEAHRLARMNRVLAIDRLQPGRKMKTMESAGEQDGGWPLLRRQVLSRKSNCPAEYL